MTRRTRAVIWCFALAFAGTVLSAPGQARERILSYDARVEVGANAEITVTETIRVRAEGRDIRRGIFRDFPIRYLEPSGTWRYVGFTVVAVARDGEDEPWHEEYLGNVRRIYIGDADTLLRPGNYTYTIRYRTTRQLRHFDDFDEVYWNVTGNFWTFPIARATATVILPPGAPILHMAAYTGPQGARGSDYQVTAESDTTVTFTTTRPLGAREGLTVAVGFAKGHARQPGPLSRALWFLWDNLGLGILLVGAISVAAWFLTAWQRVGRDPQRGVIIPLFAPPGGFSPGAISYLHYWGLKRGRSGTPLAFVAALMSLAVKKRIRFDEDDDDGTMTVERTDGNGTPLSPGEQGIEAALFSATRLRVPLDTAYATTIAKAQAGFTAAIKREYKDRFFRDNRSHFVIGAGLAVVTVFAFAAIHRPIDEQVVLLVAAFISALVGTTLLFFGLGGLLRWIPDAGSRWLSALMVPVGAIALVPALLLPVAAAGTLPALAVVAFASLPVMCVLFFHLLRAPTIAGRKVMDEIEGFKLYLTVAEAERMNLAEAPDMSTDLFERYLPHAIGLGVEKPWSQAFADYLERAVPDAADRAGYYPTWYHGSSWDSGRIAAATSGLASSIAGSVASSMPSSSGSGSTGGGSSGGGGGGGGGGGW